MAEPHAEPERDDALDAEKAGAPKGVPLQQGVSGKESQADSSDLITAQTSVLQPAETEPEIERDPFQSQGFDLESAPEIHLDAPAIILNDDFKIHLIDPSLSKYYSGSELVNYLKENHFYSAKKGLNLFFLEIRGKKRVRSASPRSAPSVAPQTTAVLVPKKVETAKNGAKKSIKD